MGLPDKIADFTVLPLLYSKTTQHILYIKEHVSNKGGGKAALLPSGRTLFVVNIPPDATERELILLFKPCGHVERVIILFNVWSPEAYGPLESSVDEVLEATEEEAVAENSDDSSHRRKRRKLSRKKDKSKRPPQVIPLPEPDHPLRTFLHSGSSAHVIFTDAGSISRALALRSASSDQRAWPPTTGAVSPWGLAHYEALHEAQRPSLQDLKAHADSFIEVYEHNKALAKQTSEYRKGEAIVDEDGFTLVRRGGAYGTTLGGGIGVASKQFMKEASTGEKATSGKRGKKPKKHEKDNFYKFQLHEKKRKELVNLKDEFEKDKKKIAQLRRSRQFKPY